MTGADMGQGTRQRSSRGQSTLEYLIVTTAIIGVIVSFLVPRITVTSRELMNKAIDKVEGK